VELIAWRGISSTDGIVIEIEIEIDKDRISVQLPRSLVAGPYLTNHGASVVAAARKGPGRPGHLLRSTAIMTPWRRVAGFPLLGTVEEGEGLLERPARRMVPGFKPLTMAGSHLLGCFSCAVSLRGKHSIPPSQSQLIPFRYPSQSKFC
jgi:hypothetical protein